MLCRTRTSPVFWLPQPRRLCAHLPDTMPICLTGTVLHRIHGILGPMSLWCGTMSRPRVRHHLPLPMFHFLLFQSCIHRQFQFLTALHRIPIPAVAAPSTTPRSLPNHGQSCSPSQISFPQVRHWQPSPLASLVWEVVFYVLGCRTPLDQHCWDVRWGTCCLMVPIYYTPVTKCFLGYFMSPPIWSFWSRST